MYFTTEDKETAHLLLRVMVVLAVLGLWQVGEIVFWVAGLLKDFL